MTLSTALEIYKKHNIKPLQTHEKVLFKKLFDYIKKNILSSEKDESAYSNGKLWTADYAAIECLRCLILDPLNYMLIKQPPDEYTQKNILWSIGDNFFYSICKLKLLQTLRSLPNSYNRLLICETGRGIEVLIGLLAKQWESIDGFDRNKLLEDTYTDFFPSNNINVNFSVTTTKAFNYTSLKQKTVIVATHSREFPKVVERWKKEHLMWIRDGKLVTEQKHLEQYWW